jgi:Flp pilus assembly protein TadB
MFLSIVLVIVGIFAIICTIMKPRFYWESRKATRLRRLIGDTAASILYIIIGILASGIGIADLLGIISL